MHACTPPKPSTERIQLPESTHQHHHLQQQPLPERHELAVFERGPEEDDGVGDGDPEGGVEEERRLRVVLVCR